ncbi:helix-turn-helix transcriptional regulator [Bacteroidia bacterium]|nr:helix-turn-helix transcriptional regulator [Bacteroidia bacterium]GHT75098.1 helix-turn-helix transcriptional regulator [Bacteroidia bacterium]GHT82802.1 helix-turn-helix transcriptional regulator [Bacteroidia bacterium]
MRNIIIADNQDISRIGLQWFCEQINDVDKVFVVSNKQELLHQLTANPCAVIILDYTTFDLASVDHLLVLQSRFADADWLLFSERLSEYFIRRLADNKKISIVLKDAPEGEILQAILSAIRAEHFICQPICILLKSSADKEQQVLTLTEKEILRLLAMGRSNKEIADERCVSIHTIATHRKNLFRKIEVNNAHEATKYALQAGVIDEAEYYI